MLASTVPTCASYDPAYVYELAVILQDGIRRMYQEGEDRLLLHHHVQRRLCDAGDAGRRAGRHCARHLQVQGRAGQGDGASFSAAARF